MDGAKIVREGYDAIAKRYLQTRCTDSKDVMLVDEFISRLPKGARVLDGGCGAGVPIARRLAEDFDVVGIDFSESQIELAKKNVPDAEFMVRDMTKLDFPDDSFDGVISYYAIIHIPRQEHQGIIDSFHRILKPGGIMLLCTGAGDLKDDINEDYLGTRMYWSHYGAEKNMQIVKKAGFEIIWAKEVGDETCDGSKHLFILART